MKLIWKVLLAIGIIILGFIFLIVGVAIKRVVSEGSPNENITSNYNTSQKIDSEPREVLSPTFWELGDLPSSVILMQEAGMDTCNSFNLKESIDSTGCVITDALTSFTYEWKGDLSTEITCKEICLNKNWLARQNESFFPMKVLIYYDFNTRGGNPKVIETEVII